ncbi:MAG: NADPH-dependent FMN reductase [Deltaproteobacteria bacterium RIFOXYD12_FULL_57_12]|nr:MAG: NADPH-dependent FMN reductase [Deltaproteobacteria bacterium RIFOXYD12_FULL_57_12]
MKVIGVSGSPIKNSTTDRAVQMVLAATEAHKTEFFKLSDYTVSPCNGCLECITTNRCVIEDDGVMLAEKAFKADVLVIGGYTSYSSLDSRTKAFIERLYPLQHRYGLMAGKLGAAVVTCAIPPDQAGLPSACANGLQAIRDYIQLAGMEWVGGIPIVGNMPCVHCGEVQCQQSGLKMVYDSDATLASVGVRSLEDDPDKIAVLEKLGADITARYYSNWR